MQHIMGLVISISHQPLTIMNLGKFPY